MADTDLKVIIKAKELMKHTYKLTSNTNRYPKKYLKMAKLVAEGKLPREKFDASYGAWKNHISHGNCYNLSKSMDRKVQEILNRGEK